jgi:ankyrin repeat protein
MKIHNLCRAIKKVYIRVKYYFYGYDVNQIVQYQGIQNVCEQRYIHVYAGNTDTSLLENEILAGANIDIPDIQGNTPLHLACARGNLPIVRLLIENKADVNLGNSGDFPPLTMCFAYSGNLEQKKSCMDALIAAGANPNYIDQYDDTASNLARRRLAGYERF